ncbi:cell wall surface anchor family protein [Reticulomyxa filosa]|uniref:Cell wall surface anchor family protein n=1 Tax=Reticulomyxa filosa TaxID=46433 RepID=X6M9D8_RETFI|nr:cell wall surface anchor family protein [Reticulomyxa filosa]|eukprot:ETO10618.1 cell wall surface anchor family protein [Reticulomyxa filosa]
MEDTENVLKDVSNGICNQARIRDVVDAKNCNNKSWLRFPHCEVNDHLSNLNGTGILENTNKENSLKETIQITSPSSNGFARPAIKLQMNIGTTATPTSEKLQLSNSTNDAGQIPQAVVIAKRAETGTLRILILKWYDDASYSRNGFVSLSKRLKALRKSETVANIKSNDINENDENCLHQNNTPTRPLFQANENNKTQDKIEMSKSPLHLLTPQHLPTTTTTTNCETLKQIPPVQVAQDLNLVSYGLNTATINSEVFHSTCLSDHLFDFLKCEHIFKKIIKDDVRNTDFNALASNYLASLTPEQLEIVSAQLLAAAEEPNNSAWLLPTRNEENSSISNSESKVGNATNFEKSNPLNVFNTVANLNGFTSSSMSPATKRSGLEDMSSFPLVTPSPPPSVLNAAFSICSPSINPACSVFVTSAIPCAVPSMGMSVASGQEYLLTNSTNPSASNTIDLIQSIDALLNSQSNIQSQPPTPTIPFNNNLLLSAGMDRDQFTTDLQTCSNLSAASINSNNLPYQTDAGQANKDRNTEHGIYPTQAMAKIDLQRYCHVSQECSPLNDELISTSANLYYCPTIDPNESSNVLNLNTNAAPVQITNMMPVHNADLASNLRDINNLSTIVSSQPTKTSTNVNN